MDSRFWEGTWAGLLKMLELLVAWRLHVREFKMWNDLLYAGRQLRRNKGFAAVAVLTLALGIGANTAIFTVMNTVMFRPLPYTEPSRLMSIYATSPQSQSWPHAAADILDFQIANRSFEKVAVFRWGLFSLAHPGEPAESVRGLFASAEFFETLKGRAELGRTFAPEEDDPGKDLVAVVSHGFWKNQFGGETNVIGRRLRLDGQEHTVIGVMPKSFDVWQLWGPVEIWRPLVIAGGERHNRQNRYLQAIGRLKQGVSREEAEAEMRAFAAGIAKEFPDTHAKASMRAAPLPHAIGDGSSRRFAWLMLGLTMFVLLIACLNLANLQLARGVTRARELAVRLALGSGRARLMRQLLMENLLIAAGGGAAGILVSVWLSDFLGARLNRWEAEGIAMPIDWRVLGFAFVCAACTGLLFGVGPAWAASRSNVNDVLKSGARGMTAGRSQHLFRHALVVAEVAVALVLLTGSALFVAGLRQFVEHKPGWTVDGLLGGWVPASAKFGENRQEFVRLLEERLSSIPGVRQAAICTSIPVWSFRSGRNFVVEGQPLPPLGQDPIITSESVTPKYFETMQIGLRMGRLFDATDTAGRPKVAIVNESMARKFWPNESPVGRRIGVGHRNAPEWLEVVGVVNDLRFPGNLNRPETLWQMYRPMAQEMQNYFGIALRTVGPPENYSEAVRRVVADLDADLPVNELEPTRELVDRVLGHFTLAGKVLTAFSCLGLALAGIGIYGVISFLVAQRTGEIGVRMALGAAAKDVLWLVGGKGLLMTLLGVVLGGVGTVGIAAALRAAAPEISTSDPLVFVMVASAMAAVTVAAVGLPALKAVKVDPAICLRNE